MKTNLHIIQKQAVHLTVSRRENTLALQQRFERMLEEQLLPHLEPVFDRLAGPDVWIELDKLEIPVVELDPHASEADWLGKVFRAYVTALEGRIQKSATVKRSAPSENLEEVLAYFLKRGHLPWWVENFDLEAAIRKQLPRVAGKLIRLLAEPDARRRWVRQFSEKFQKDLWREVAGKRLKALSQNQKIKEAPHFSLEQWVAQFPELPQPQLKYIYWETIWEALQSPADFEVNWVEMLMHRTLINLSGEAALAKYSQIIHQNPYLPEPVKTQLLRASEHRFPLTFQQWQALLPKRSGRKTQDVFWESVREVSLLSPGFQQQWPALLIAKALPVLAEEGAVAELQQAVRYSPSLSEKVKRQLLQAIDMPPSFPSKREIPLPQQPANKPLPDTESLFVSLAGMVLCHPFLPAFFERLKLLEGEQFRNEAARERAVHLLYFLATGLQQPDEQETVLLKLLCGMELEYPIEKGIKLNNTEKKEANRLLEALIQNWEALEGSGPDDVRGSFLIRSGKLQRNAMGWQVKVEQQAFDILLTQLPWGLSPIRYGWMPEMIWVDWG